MKPAGKLIIFFVVIGVVNQFNFCNAEIDPGEWTIFSTFKTLNRPAMVPKLTRDVIARWETLIKISQDQDPRAQHPEQLLIDVKKVYTAKVFALDYEYRKNNKQWGPVYEDFMTVAETECAKIGLLAGSVALLKNPALNVFASKLAMAWAYTARILAEYSAGKFSGASQVINVAYEVKIGPLVK